MLLNVTQFNQKAWIWWYISVYDIHNTYVKTSTTHYAPLWCIKLLVCIKRVWAYSDFPLKFRKKFLLFRNLEKWITIMKIKLSNSSLIASRFQVKIKLYHNHLYILQYNLYILLKITRFSWRKILLKFLWNQVSREIILVHAAYLIIISRKTPD